MRPLSSFNATGLSAGQLPQHPSPWHSPIPYLFGGLAAMLGLIAFALLILACSYWKLSGYLGNGGDQNGQLSQESGEGSEKQLESIKVCKELEEQIVVIMAGDQKPTFLANPISSKAPSFTENKEMVVKSCCEEGGEKKRSEEQRSQGGENQ